MLLSYLVNHCFAYECKLYSSELSQIISFLYSGANGERCVIRKTYQYFTSFNYCHYYCGNRRYLLLCVF